MGVSPLLSLATTITRFWN